MSCITCRTVCNPSRSGAVCAPSALAPQLFLKRVQAAVEEEQRLMHLLRFGFHLVRLKDIVARCIDAPRQLPELRAFLQPFAPRLVDPDGLHIDPHELVGKVQAQRDREDGESHQQIKQAVPAGQRGSLLVRSRVAGCRA